MWIGHRKESFRISLRWPIHIINPVDYSKVSRLILGYLQSASAQRRPWYLVKNF